MPINHLTDQEIALQLARAIRAWRINPRGAGLTQVELARHSGVGLTPLKRFEKTGGTTLANLIAILRGLDLLDRLEDLVPDPDSPGPMVVRMQREQPLATSNSTSPIRMRFQPSSA